MARQTDPETCELLARVAELEAAPWPDALGAYGETLLGLAIRCESPEGQAEVLRWFQRARGGMLVDPDQRQAECKADALRDAAARSAGLMLRYRSSLRVDRRPNLLSMLLAWIRWHARDLHVSRYRRHAEREDDKAVRDDRLGDFAGRSSPMWSTEASLILQRLHASGRALDEALILLGLGCSVAEAARRTGCSRQRIYRARKAFARACGWDQDE